MMIRVSVLLIIRIYLEENAENRNYFPMAGHLQKITFRILFHSATFPATLAQKKIFKRNSALFPFA